MSQADRQTIQRRYRINKLRAAKASALGLKAATNLAQDRADAALRLLIDDTGEG